MKGGMGSVSNRSPPTSISSESVSILISAPGLAAATTSARVICRQAEVEAVAVEDSSEALANNAHNLGSLHRVWDMLTRGACLEVPTDDEYRRPIELIAE